MARFDNKIVVVTGSGSGIGRETAVCFLEEGADVIGLDIADPDPITHPKMTYHHLDVSDLQAWEAFIPQLQTRGRIDILINVAGIPDLAPIHEISQARWRHVLAIDLDGVLWGMQTVIPFMREHGGSVVNFSSVVALVGVQGGAAYAVAKGGVRSLSRNGAITYAADNIRVNSIHPGVIDTPLVSAHGEGFSEALVEKTPLGRMGTVREIARTVLFMSSDDAAFMTGAEIVVDGGWTAQ